MKSKIYIPTIKKGTEFEVDGKKTTYNFDYELNLTYEQILDIISMKDRGLGEDYIIFHYSEQKVRIKVNDILLIEN